MNRFDCWEWYTYTGGEILVSCDDFHTRQEAVDDFGRWQSGEGFTYATPESLANRFRKLL